MKLDHYRFHHVQVCCHAVCGSTSVSVSIWWTWKSDWTSAKALNVVCWVTGLQIVQAWWNGHTARAVVSEFKAVWVEHCGWPEVIVHDQGPEFVGSEFQNPAGAASVWTMPIDSQSPWHNGKTEKTGQLFKHQLRDMDGECHIEVIIEFEAAIVECCDARNRYCNRSGFSTHQRVFGSNLRLPGSLLTRHVLHKQQVWHVTGVNGETMSMLVTKLWYGVTISCRGGEVGKNQELWLLYRRRQLHSGFLCVLACLNVRASKCAKRQTLRGSAPS